MQHREMTRKKWLDSDSAPFVVLLLGLVGFCHEVLGRLLFFKTHMEIGVRYEFIKKKKNLGVVHSLTIVPFFRS